MQYKAREIRKVPENWTHPTDTNGEFIPLFDDTFDAAYKYWADGLQKWMAGKPSKPTDEWQSTVRSYILFEGVCPDANSCADYKGQKRSHYVLYDVQSDGTPLTPAFASLDQLKEYLVNAGSKLDGKYTPEEATSLCAAYEPVERAHERERLKKARELAESWTTSSQKRPKKTL
jgi:hypothetical protein